MGALTAPSPHSIRFRGNGCFDEVWNERLQAARPAFAVVKDA
jgi:hypothetical protein